MHVLLALSATLAPGIVTLVAFAVVGVALGAIGSVVARRLSNPVTKYRLLYVAVLLPVAVLAFVVLSFVGFGAAVADRVAVIDGPIAAVLGTFVEVSAAGLVWLLGYVPTVRGVAAVRDVDLGLWSAVRSMVRYLLGVSVVVTIAIAPLRILPAAPSLPILAVGLVVIVVAFLYGSPWLVPLVRSTTRPTGARAERVDALIDDVELAVRDVLFLETEDQQTASTLVRGPPGYRRLFVTTTFLDVFDDQTARALLAVESARLQTYALEVRIASIAGGGIALVVSLAVDQFRWVAFGVALAVVLVGFWAARREMRRGDDLAADRVGAADLAAALRAYADVHSMDPPRRRVPNPLSATVPLGDRIDRLE